MRRLIRLVHELCIRSVLASVLQLILALIIAAIYPRIPNFHHRSPQSFHS